MGIMRLDETGRVAGFLEKPQTNKEMDMVRMDPAWIDPRGIPSRGRDMLASMGIYLFDRHTLVDLLTKTDYHDSAAKSFRPPCGPTRSRSTCSTAIGKTSARSARFTTPTWPWPARHPVRWVAGNKPIYTRARFLPPSRVDGATVRGSLISDGCTIEAGATIENSVVGLRCRIGRDVTIRNSILMGADFYESARRRRPAGPRRSAPRNRPRQPDRRGDHRQEQPHRRRCPDRQRPPVSHHRRNARGDDRSTASSSCKKGPS